MFEQIEEPEERSARDWTATVIGLMLLPVFFLFVYLGKAETGFTVVLVLGMILLAIKLQWRLRKHVWFWAAIAVVLALHVPFLFIVRWPDTKTPTIAYSLPLGIVDFLIISGVIRLSENIFSKQSLSDDDKQ